MTAPSTVVILAADDDPTADRVAVELTSRGTPVVRVDTADFPTQLRLTACFSNALPQWMGSLTGTTNSGRKIRVALDEVRSIYYRHPTQFRLPEGMSEPERIFTYNEARRGFGGTLQALDCLWINDPVCAAAAEYKPVQLQAAAAAGLTVPETIVTNDGHQAYTWASEQERSIIYKPVGGVWHPEDSQIKIIYTSQVDDLASLRDGSVELTAHLFQEWIDKAYEARAMVVGDEVYTVAIFADSDAAHIDWRADYDAHRYEVIELPMAVREGLVRLHRRLGLTFGACDLAVTPTGEWVFFEVNPAGQWGWLAEHCELPIAGALADILQEGLHGSLRG